MAVRLDAFKFLFVPRGLTASGVVSSSLLREVFPGSRIKVHRQHSRMAPTLPSQAVEPRPTNAITYAADLYQTSASTESPANLDQMNPVHNSSPLSSSSQPQVRATFSRHLDNFQRNKSLLLESSRWESCEPTGPNRNREQDVCEA